jgi:hypothetical protein
VRAGGASAAGLLLSLGLGCSSEPSPPPKHVSDETSNNQILWAPQPSTPPFPPASPPPPVQCDIACGPSFTLALPETLRWPPGTYYFRVAKDANPAQVCSVVFEPVFGASRDNCAGDFTVSYRYDSDVQRIESIDFRGTLQHLRVEVLTEENAPHVFDFEDDLLPKVSSNCAGGCITYHASGRGLPAADAGAAPDAGDAGTESDAATDSGAP